MDHDISYGHMDFIDKLPGHPNKGVVKTEWKRQLQANPGQWAKLPIKIAPYAPSQREGFEFKYRSGDLYGRWVGNG